MQPKRILLIIILLLLASVSYTLFDGPIMQQVPSLHHPIVTVIMKALSIIGSAYFLVPINLLILLAFYKQNKKLAILLPLSTLIVWLLNSGLKLIFTRARPDILQLVSESSYSFPSGHAMTNSFFWLALAFVILILFDKKIKGPLIVLIIFIAFSRVYLGVHYPSDVLVGALIGYLLYLVFEKIIQQSVKLDIPPTTLE